MMSDKFAQRFLQDSSDNLLQRSLPAGLGPIPVVNRSSATMEAIKAYILSHDLRPGSPLPTEAELCAELGVSRSSVREALRKLEALDIVYVHQGRGTFVGDMSLRPLVETLTLRASLSTENSTVSLRDVVALRKYLDLGMSAEIAEGFAGTHHQGLHDVVDAMVAKAARGERFLEEDSAFHLGILETLGNVVAEQMVSALWLVHQVVVPSLSDDDGDDLAATARAHGDILRAAEAGDRKAYRKAVRKHYKPLEIILDRNEKEAEARASAKAEVLGQAEPTEGTQEEPEA
ncbi:FadR/GntR family transcriptional regulator [Changpingibacter yushuensis]|uniref:FadR/GntR family transcriptional regulator n=1 Tax=Changpingibacter yushuensis TaxID=2758440 RepID=UPI0015F5F837|nr:GntR family transcriptional regulator [Changpingibacter yushuensis]